MAAAEPLGRYEPFGERLRQFPLDSALAQRDTLAPLDTCASVLAPPCSTLRRPPPASARLQRVVDRTLPACVTGSC